MPATSGKRTEKKKGTWRKKKAKEGSGRVAGTPSSDLAGVLERSAARCCKDWLKIEA